MRFEISETALAKQGAIPAHERNLIQSHAAQGLSLVFNGPFAKRATRRVYYYRCKRDPTYHERFEKALALAARAEQKPTTGRLEIDARALEVFGAIKSWYRFGIRGFVLRGNHIGFTEWIRGSENFQDLEAYYSQCAKDPTYHERFEKALAARTHRQGQPADVVHVDLNAQGATTGRWSGSQPNVQELPRKYPGTFVELGDVPLPKYGVDLGVALHKELERALQATTPTVSWNEISVHITTPKAPNMHTLDTLEENLNLIRENPKAVDRALEASRKTFIESNVEFTTKRDVDAAINDHEVQTRKEAEALEALKAKHAAAAALRRQNIQKLSAEHARALTIKGELFGNAVKKTSKKGKAK